MAIFSIPSEQLCVILRQSVDNKNSLNVAFALACLKHLFILYTHCIAIAVRFNRDFAFRESDVVCPRSNMENGKSK